MDAGHWQTVKKILSDALEIEVEDRDDFVRSACDGNTSLLRDVSELLSYDNNGNGHLEASAASAILGRDIPVGRVIGRYRVTGDLGEGGMGSVYLAERADGEFEQKVAIKLIRGGLVSGAVVDRFVNERRILATLEHPNIARLIDGGTTDDGVPYFVMEYVDGRPITEYIRDNDCDLDTRLSIFARICSAVGYAHRNLIIHRDLKPSNILMTADGDVKLLDFGIAKFLDPAMPRDAQTQQFALTPEYASPEQLRGERLTTATDIYSLGVLLYELLTGLRPIETTGKHLGEVIRTVSETLPRRPSSVIRDERATEKALPGSGLARQLRGDLDSIILKALRKEPADRYRSVEEFAADLSRYTEGKPVAARSGVWTYRARKFVGRNRIAVIAATAVFVTLVAGLITTLYQARVASAERAKAEKRFNDVRQLANSFVFEINDEIEKSPIKARALMVQRAIEYLDSLSSEAANDDQLTAELASAYEKIGDVQSQIFNAGLGNAGDALASQQKALGLRTRLFDAEPSNAQRGLDLANGHQKVGSLLKVTGDIDAAADQFRRSVAIAERLAATPPADPSVKIALSNAHLLLGQAILRSGSLSESLANYQRSFAITQELLADDPSHVDIERRLSVAHSYMAYVAILMGDYAEAVEHSERALEIDRRAAARDPADQRLKRSLSASVLWLGISYREAGRSDEAMARFREALELQRNILAADPDNYGEKNSMADCWLELGIALDVSGKERDAITAFQKALDLYTVVASHDPNDLSASVQALRTTRYIADCQLKIGRTSEARHGYELSLDGLKDLADRDPKNLEWEYERSLCLSGLGKTLHRLKHDPEALSDLREAEVGYQELTAASPENVKYKASLAETKSLLATLR